MSIKEFFKKLFSKKTSTPVVEQETTVTDVFGHPLDSADYVVRVKYNDLVRRGYVTIPVDFDVMHPNMDLKTDRVYIKFSKLSELKQTNSKRRGYLHVANA